MDCVPEAQSVYPGQSVTCCRQLGMKLGRCLRGTLGFDRGTIDDPR